MKDPESIIVELVFTPWEELPNKLKKLGVEFTLYEDRDLIGITNSQMSAGITKGLDPITTAVQFGFGFCGMNWTKVLPTLLDKVNKRWKEESKRGKKVQG